jgi:alpha-N-arabinofuranosidase
VRYFQIDNEPMNNGFTPERYAAIVNLYGSRLRQIAPDAVIIACGQKRSNDMAWSEQVIDLAGANFDVLGVHNYEYEGDLFEPGVRRIRDYLVKLRDYVRASPHPGIRLAVLEWNLSRTYDWRAGLHAAGSLILYESLTPELTMTSPALLMRHSSITITCRGFRAPATSLRSCSANILPRGTWRRRPARSATSTTGRASSATFPR